MRTRLVLDGIWNFAFCGEAGEIPAVFPETMAVPGCFDMVSPYYGQRGVAAYQKIVSCDGKVRLFIEGLGLTAKIYWDRKLIGECKYAYMPEEFVFSAGPLGDHELIILVDNRYPESFHPNFDFYGYGGIYGQVILEKLDGNWIKEVFVSTEDYQNGIVKIRVHLDEETTVAGELFFDDNQPVKVNFICGQLDMNMQVPNFKLWSVEQPALHKLTVRIPTDERQENFGIRHIESRGRQLYLNGKNIKLFGYNRHESFPEVGAATSLTIQAADLRQIKNQGANFIRGCHYPQRRSFLDLCDRMGILVWEETLSWGIEAPELHTPEFLASQQEQADKLTRISFNHPCVIIRGFLNENDSSMPETRAVIKGIYDTIRAVDEHCLISFASNRYERDVCWDLVDVVAMNPYPGWYDATDEENSTVHKVIPRLKQISDLIPENKPLIISEIGCEALLGFRDHLQLRWTEEYQAKVLIEVCKFVFNGDECAGVAIWQFADTRSYVTGEHIYARPRGFNNKGVLNEHRQPKLAWNMIENFLVRQNSKGLNFAHLTINHKE